MRWIWCSVIPPTRPPFCFRSSGPIVPARLILERPEEVDGEDHELLVPLAEALEREHRLLTPASAREQAALRQLSGLPQTVWELLE